MNRGALSRANSTAQLLGHFAFPGILLAVMSAVSFPHCAKPQASASPEVTRVEPPNWWIDLTPGVLVLLSGHNLEATHAGCNLPTVRVMRTQATAGGDYLFVWLKIGPATRSGTAVCRITTRTGQTSFELPLAVRGATAGKFQGLAPDEAVSSADSDLRAARERLPEFKRRGSTALLIALLTPPNSDPDLSDHGVVDFYSVDPRRGSLRDLKELIAAAHEQHTKVALDLELLHISSRHPWVTKSPLAEWLGGSPIGAGSSSQSLATSSSSGRILDTENPLVALYLLQDSIWWTESSGSDELRVISDPRTTNQFWSTWRAALQRIYPRLGIIRESSQFK